MLIAIQLHIAQVGIGLTGEGQVEVGQIREGQTLPNFERHLCWRKKVLVLGVSIVGVETHGGDGSKATGGTSGRSDLDRDRRIGMFLAGKGKGACLLERHMLCFPRIDNDKAQARVGLGGQGKGLLRSIDDGEGIPFLERDTALLEGIVCSNGDGHWSITLASGTILRGRGDGHAIVGI